MSKIVEINNIRISNNLPFILIAGPCQMESEDHVIDIAYKLKETTDKKGISFIFKTSFDKANRSSAEGKRGVGLEKALPIFQKIKEKVQCPVITDVHLPHQCAEIAKVVDVLQIPAFLCRQTDLLIAAAQTQKVVNIKKGQFASPYDMQNMVNKILSQNNEKIILTERGTFFGYNNLVNDMRGLEIMKKTGFPVIFDATHSVQQPGGLGSSSGGQREFILPLAKSAIALGIAGLFIETHENPDQAPSDGPCMLPLNQLSNFLDEMIRFDQVAKKSI